jgi:hypothetical protein
MQKIWSYPSYILIQQILEGSLKQKVKSYNYVWTKSSKFKRIEWIGNRKQEIERAVYCVGMIQIATEATIEKKTKMQEEIKLCT